MRRWFGVLGLALALAWMTAPGFGQREKRDQEATVRSVQGSVTGPDGNLIEGAVVHLKNTKTLQIRSYITKGEGTYSFHGLSTNVDYELKAEHQGMASDVKTLSVFDSRSNAVVNLKLNKK